MKIPLTDSGGCGIKVGRGCENYSTFAPEKCQNVFQHILIGGTNMSTTLLNKDTVTRKWYVLDAAGKPMGKTAALAADLLRGKLKTDYTPHVDCGDFVIIINAEQAVLTGKKLEQKMRKNEFDFEMYLDSMSQMKKMGGLSSVMGMMPGMGIGGGKMPDIDTDEAEKGMARTEAIIYSMTPEERRNPKLLNPSRKARIARGAGVDVSEVNRLVKQFEQTKKFMKQMPGMMGGKKGRRGGGGLGGLFKGLPF